MPTHPEFFSQRNTQSNLLDRFQRTQCFLYFQREDLSWSIFVSGVSDPSFSTSLAMNPGQSTQTSQDHHHHSDLRKEHFWRSSGNNWHSTVTSMKEQLSLLLQPPRTSTKPAANALWHLQSSSSLNQAFTPAKAGNVLHYFMVAVGALQLDRAKGTFSSTALMCWEGHWHFVTNFPCCFSWYKMLSGWNSLP